MEDIESKPKKGTLGMCLMYLNCIILVHFINHCRVFISSAHYGDNGHSSYMYYGCDYPIIVYNHKLVNHN